MKKRYLLPILLSAFTLAATAQNLTTKAVVVYKSDHTQDTIMWNNIMGSGTYFYGKENPTDNDYVTLSFTLDDYGMTYSTRLTPAGEKAPYQAYGTMLSTSHINAIPDNLYGWATQIYFVDKKQWYRSDYGIGGDEVIRYDNVKEYFSFIPGQSLYVRAFYLLDDNPYFSSEITARAPKTKSIMRELVYYDYSSLNDSIIFKADVAKIIENNKEMFTYTTDYERQLVLQYVHRVISNMATSDVMAMVTKTEICDNGILYIIDDVSSSVLNDALNIINEEVLQPFYVQANLKTVFEGSGVTTDFGTMKCTPTIYEVDEKWGIRDNQYLYTYLQGTTAKPSLALMMNHLMKPGKVYDVTLTFAPNIRNEEADTLNTYFYVSIAGEMNNGKMPKLTSAQTFGNDTTVNNRGLFIARPHELKVMTMQYTPANFTNVHVLQLNHQFSFTSSANRRRYGQEFRVVGIEVKPHE